MSSVRWLDTHQCLFNIQTSEFSLSASQKQGKAKGRLYMTPVPLVLKMTFGFSFLQCFDIVLCVILGKPYLFHSIPRASHCLTL